jgi:class 3 adenylate cyclase
METAGSCCRIRRKRKPRGEGSARWNLAWESLPQPRNGVSGLAWAGQHAQAIELATAALAAAGLRVGSRLDLLDLRAESSIAQGDLERAGADADAMLGLADHARTATFKALSGHAESAVRAAQEMVELIDLFNVDRQAAERPPIKIGIGIASGEMMAGYTGTNQRATYTCTGVETHTKVAQRAILIDQATRSALSERITVEPLGLVPFKGKAVAWMCFRSIPGSSASPERAP